MKISFNEVGWADYVWWQGEPSVRLQRLNRLIFECTRHPFSGTGKPEPLKAEFKGWWSRRITEEHRLVYRVIGSGEDQSLQITQCRFHY